ncbi:MAG: diacylglycerol kinase family protein [Gemmatimonadota bacterium]
MTRALIITNPAAARTAPGVVSVIMDTLRTGGWEAELAATSGPGDARRLAEYGVEEKMDVVVVFGGDGTTMQAAAALVGTEVNLGLIPGGTGNLLAGNLRVPTSPARAAAALLRSHRRRLDLGRMERPDGVHYFAVACGAGYDARVMSETPSELKRKWGMGAYVATTLRLIGELKSVDYVITVDGQEFDAHAAMVLVANCGEVIPPYVKLGPNIRPNDGLLDVVVMRANNFGEGVRAVWDLLRTRPPASAGSFVGFARGREVRLESHPAQPAQLDGEPGGTTPFTATIVPDAIWVLAPGPAPA